MPYPFYAKEFLTRLGASVEEIPTSDKTGKKEADFLATFSGIKVLIEEKAKSVDPTLAVYRESILESGQIYSESLPITRNETLSSIIRHASKQLLSSSDKPHDFRFVWFTATGSNAQVKYEQFIATLYGTTRIYEMNTSYHRECYFFRNSDFHFHSSILDGAIVAQIDGNTISMRLCLNPLSARFLALQQSAVVEHFGTAVLDPTKYEKEGTAFILDSNLDRKIESPLLQFLQQKYQTNPLMPFNLGHVSAALLFDNVNTK